jgi:tetratricopeptide (TPR) repeat protein
MKTHPGAASFDELHAVDYLVYAYLQGAQDEKAGRLLAQVKGVTKVDVEQFAAAYAFAAVPARYALERRQWADAAKLEIHPSTFPWQNFQYAEALIHFARAIGAARSGDPSSARAALDKLSSIREALTNKKDMYWANQVEIQRQGAAAWLAFAEGNQDEALKLMRSAADLEAASEKHPVTPGAVVPTRELLGDMLLELKRSEEALAAYESSLLDSPRRFNGLYGAARAAQLSGNQKKAAAYYAKVVSLTARADTVRPELREARQLLRRGNGSLSRSEVSTTPQ